MNEKEIAENKVLPHLEKLGWPKQLMTQYGKVPVQMGTKVKWADVLLLFVDENDVAIPYSVMEVKTRLDDLNQVLAQTDSYSKFLDTPYFAITDGSVYLFYQRSPTGGRIKISNLPIPDKKHLTATRKTKFKPGFILCAKPDTEIETNQYGELNDRIDDYFNLMAENKYYLGRNGTYTLRRDITFHYRSIKCIQDLIHVEFDSLKPDEFKSFFEYNIMCYRPPNLNRIDFEVGHNFDKIKSFILAIKDFQENPENLSRLLDPSSKIHVSGMGSFIVSQFLAGAYPRKYTIVEDRMVKTMKELALIDTKVRSNTAKGYLYINEMCRKLYDEIFRRKIKENRNRLGFKVDEDFGLILVHEFFWEFEEFNSYNIMQLKEATGHQRKKEEELTEENLELLNYFMSPL